MFPFIFVGPCGYVNIGTWISRSAMDEFIHGGLVLSVLPLSLNVVGGQLSKCLVSLYPAMRYDLHVHVKLDRSDNTAVGSCEGYRELLNHERTIHDLVTKAISNRAKLVCVQHQPFVNSSEVIDPWLVLPRHHQRNGSTQRSKTQKMRLTSTRCSLELFSDPEHALRLVDLGPSSDNDKFGKEFRAFWGDSIESPWEGLKMG